VVLFETQFRRLYRVLDRLSGDPELAADLAQEAFVRLHQRGTLPDDPPAWLISVAMNLFRNERSSVSRRHRLLGGGRGARVQADPAISPLEAVESEEARLRVRQVVAALPERDQRLLLLRAEGYSYREIASALSLNAASVGTLLARAQRAFRVSYEERIHAG
jgi:RNA polymerase sigma-70 factor (ECF subfamily)